MARTTKVIEVLQTSPGGKHIVRLRKPHAVKDKGLDAVSARASAVALCRKMRRLGLRCRIVFV